MYSRYENPMLKASIFYYDDAYDESISANVLSILKKHCLFPPQKIYADQLTHRRYLNANANTEVLFIRSYSEKDVFGVDMASGDGRVGSEFWRFTWDFTFLKNSDIGLSKIVFKPWNVISLSSTYGRLYDIDTYNNFINCTKAIISEVKPFYAGIDDVDNKVKKSGTQGLRFDEHTLPRTVYWGNYWGNQYVKLTNPRAFDYLLKNGAICEGIGDGRYFSMTDSAFDFGTKRVIQMEHKFRKLV